MRKYQQYLALCEEGDPGKRDDLYRNYCRGWFIGSKKAKKELAEEWFPYIPEDSEVSYIEDRFLQKPLNGGCFYLYRSVTINPVGVLAPCCAVYRDDDSFGNMLETDFLSIWNNDFYQNARALFTKQGKSHIKTVCNRCTIFLKR